MLRRRSQAARSGLWAGLGSVPVGFVVEKVKESTTYGMFIIYEPHARVVRWIFIRFVELGYDFYKLCKEIREIPVLFPDLEAGVFTRCALSPGNDGGYVLKSEDGLRYLLTNVAYIGVLKAEGMYKQHNHEPIIGETLFWSVYDRLRCTRPDGTSTGKISLVRYSQEASVLAREPLIKRLFSTPTHYVQSIKLGRYYYQLVEYTTLGREVRLSIEADDLEGIIVKRIFQILRERSIGDIKKARKIRDQEKNRRLHEIEREYQTIDEEIETLLSNLGKTKIVDVVHKIEGKIAKLIERQTNLAEEKDLITREYASVQLGTLEEELQDLEEFWDDRSFDAKKGLVSLLIKEIIWEFLSPRFYKLRIVWAYKEWGIEDAIFDRRHVGSKPWTKEEEAIIEGMYPTCEQVDILRALSQRTWRGITVRASKLGVKREGKPAMVEQNLSYQDMQFLEEYGLDLADFSDCNHTSWSRHFDVHV